MLAGVNPVTKAFTVVLPGEEVVVRLTVSNKEPAGKTRLWGTVAVWRFVEESWIVRFDAGTYGIPEVRFLNSSTRA